MSFTDRCEVIYEFYFDDRGRRTSLPSTAARRLYFRSCWFF